MTRKYLSITACLLVLVLSSHLKLINAQDVEERRLPTLHLLVTLNGKKLVGIQELTSQFTKEGKNEAAFKAAFEAAVVRLRRGSSSVLAIYVDDANGKQEKVTRKNGVGIFSTLAQVRFDRGNLIASPSDAIGRLDIPGPISLFVYYYEDIAMDKGKFGFNQFFIKLLDEKSE